MNLRHKLREKGFIQNYRSIDMSLDSTTDSKSDDNTVSNNASNGSLLHTRRYPDGGYGYVIVFCSFLLYLIADGISYPLGLINSQWLVYFKESETKTSFVGSIFYATPLLSGPFMSKLIEKYGCKKMTMIGAVIGSIGFIMSSLCTSIVQLYIAVGVIGGSGLSAAYIVGLLTVERWFDAKRSLAIGIVSAGTGFGTFIFPPITAYLLERVGWKLTMICLSGILMMIALVGAFLDDPLWKLEEDSARKAEKNGRRAQNTVEPKERKKFIDKVKVFVDFSFFKNGNFALLGLSTFTIYAFYNTAIYFLSEMLKDFDYTESESARFLSAIGFFLTLGMIAQGWLADRKIINAVVLNGLCVLVCGISEALMPMFAGNVVLLAVLCALFGFSFASAYVLIPKIAEMIVGVDNFASAIGLNFFMQGLGLLLGTPFAGWIFETTGSWAISFYVSGGFIAVSSILSFMITAKEREVPVAVAESNGHYQNV